MSVSRETLAARYDVSRETLLKLDKLATLLEAWNSSINLVSRQSTEEIWSRHIGDSLQLLPLMVPQPTRAIDLGSGGGFPGLVLAIATGIHFDLIESDRRKASFLVEAARQSGAPARVYPARIETRPCAPAPLITSRALAPLCKLLSLAAPLLQRGGEMLFLKGKSAAEEIAVAQTKWTMRLSRTTSALDPSGVILRISEVAIVK